MILSADEYNFILQRDLMSFIERSFYDLNPQTPFIHGGHIEAIAAKLEACRRGEIRRLIINLPPRNLKSHCASIAFPAWVLGHNPSAQVICASYGQDLADKLARDCRTIMSSPWYQRVFPTRIADDRRSVHDFMTTASGSRMATSVGGVLTGRGADLILIDDPLKPTDALSKTQRSAVNDWYDNTLQSRLNDKAKGCIAIIMQRLHQDDLVGHLCEREPWDVLSFPAIAPCEESITTRSFLGPSVFRRSEGHALHPERETLQTLREIRARIGEYNFQSQYQQDPSPEGGAMIKREWLKFYAAGEYPSSFNRIVMSWDTANKTTELSDYSVCTVWGVLYKKYYLLEVFRRRLNYPELRRAVKELAQRYNPMTILVEDKASGTQLIQDLQADGIMGIKPYNPLPGVDKIMRLHAQTSMFENGLVWLPREAPWLNDYLSELLSFPGSKYNDQVDSTTQALDHFSADFALEIWAKLAG
jgi:predicted phage terminase large subunit-like protein